MKQDETLIIRALLGNKKPIYRDIEIEAIREWPGHAVGSTSPRDNLR